MAARASTLFCAGMLHVSEHERRADTDERYREATREEVLSQRCADA